MRLFKAGKLLHPVGLIHPRSLRYLSDKLHSFVKGRLWLKVLLGMALGVIVGAFLSESMGMTDRATAQFITEWLALPGVIFLRIIQLIVIPLVLASIINGMAASESMRQLRRTGLLAGTYFLVTTLLAIGIGLALADWIQPGAYISQDALRLADTDGIRDLERDFEPPTLEELPRAIGGVLPANIFGSLLDGHMLQIVLMALIFGVALVSMRAEQSKPILELLSSLQEVSMTIVRWAMMLAPVAVFGLMAKFIANFGLETLLGIAVYFGTVILGLSILLVSYLILVAVIARHHPLKFLAEARDAMLLAFSTSSSAAVMPLTMKTAEEKMHVRTSLSQFIIPIGATINMNGTALYQAIATMFLAQAFHVELSLAATALLVTTIVASSIGSPGTPGVGIAILSTILTGAGIPIAGVALILGVDRILDMSRTVVNVTGDLTACVLADHFIPSTKTKEELQRQEKSFEAKREKTGESVIVQPQKRTA